MPAVFDHRDVDVDDVAIAQFLAIRGDAVANHFVHRRADRFRKAFVVKRCGDRFLHVNDMIVANAVNFAGRHAYFDLRSDHLENLRGETARFAHGINLSVGFGYHGAHQRLSAVMDPQGARV